MKVKMIIKNGKVSIETLDIRGSKCTEIADQLAQYLGTKTKQDLKPQYYDEHEVVQQRDND
jgi:hypothetical protein